MIIMAMEGKKAIKVDMIAIMIMTMGNHIRKRIIIKVDINK